MSTTGDGTPGYAVQRSAVVTGDVAVASAVLERLYAGSRFEVGRPTDDFEFRMVNATAGPLMLSLVHYGFPGRVDVAPVSSFTTVIGQAGSMHVAAGNRPVRTVGSGDVWRWVTDEDMRADYDPDSDFLMLQLPLSVIAEAAAESSGDGAAGGDATRGSAAVRFLDTSPVDAAAERYWAALGRFAHQQATATDSPLNNPLLRAQLIRALAGAALVTFPNTTMTTDYVPGAGDVGPTTLRRALAHLHAHAAEPLTVGDLAGAAGIGVRALQQAFTSQLGATPMTHLRRVRLERAHHDLRAGDPTAGDTVAAIASRWGFGHPGRFAAAYQAQYAVSPSTTLRT